MSRIHGCKHGTKETHPADGHKQLDAGLASGPEVEEGRQPDFNARGEAACKGGSGTRQSGRDGAWHKLQTARALGLPRNAEDDEQDIDDISGT